jgi:predicted regulator of Ras-like GTPase activity (Roadblock/LC7/MglB family)
MNLEDSGTARALLEAVKVIPGVTGTVIVAHDGAVTAQEITGDPEKEGALAAYLGQAAARIGETLALNPMRWAVVALGQEGVMVLQHGESYLGLFLDDHASPAMVASRALAALSSEKGSA